MDSSKGEQIKDINVESRTIIDEKDREIARLKDMLNDARKLNIEKDKRIDNLNQLVDRMKEIIENNTNNINRQLEEAMSDLFFGRYKKDSYRSNGTYSLIQFNPPPTNHIDTLNPPIFQKASNMINNPQPIQQQLQQQQQQPVPELHLFPKKRS